MKSYKAGLPNGAQCMRRWKLSGMHSPNILNLSWRLAKASMNYRLKMELHMAQRKRNPTFNILSQRGLYNVHPRILKGLTQLSGAVDILDHQVTNNLLPTRQHGFISGWSCVTPSQATLASWTEMHWRRNTDCIYLEGWIPSYMHASSRELYSIRCTLSWREETRGCLPTAYYQC